MKKRFTALSSLFAGGDFRNMMARNVFSSLLLRAVYMGLTFCVTVLLSRALGVEGFGIYSYIFALVSLLFIPAEFGLPYLVVRETARAASGAEWGAIKGLWRWSGNFIILFIAILLIVVFFGVSLLSQQFSLQQVHTFFLGFVLASFAAIGSLRSAALRGLGRVIQGQLPELLTLLFSTLLLLTAIFIFSGFTLTVDLAMMLQVLSAAISFLVGAWLLWRATPSEVRIAKPIYNSSDWISSMWRLAFIGGIALVINRTSIVILGFFTDALDVGLYRVADQMSVLASSGLLAINMVVAPQFARLHTTGDKERLERLAVASARVVFALSVPVVIVFVFFGRVMLRFVFGSAYEAAYVPLSILAVGQLINSGIGSVGLLLNMTGYEQEVAHRLLIASVGSIVLNLTLIPRWGASGAALASTTTTIIWNLLLWSAVRRRLGINSMALKLF